MGKRPTNATKGGKFMNPTDQARKEARRRELKKNKKQRILVRSAVLKGKRPQEVIEELSKIDDMEYNPVTPCPLNQKVMAEKRKKLMETWDRLFLMYEKEVPDKYEELKKQWAEYQSRKMDVVRYYESVMAAKHVQIDAIPLPNMSTGEVGDWDEENIPLPPSAPQLPKSSLKKTTDMSDLMKTKICPGVPPGAPPPIQEYEDTSLPEKDSRKRKIRFGSDDELSDDEHHNRDRDEEPEAPGTSTRDNDKEQDLDDELGSKPAPKPSSLQIKMLEMAGQDVDQFIKEMEEVHKQKEREREENLQRRLARLEKNESKRSRDDDRRRDDRDDRRYDRDDRRYDRDDRRDDRSREDRDRDDRGDRRRDNFSMPVRPGVPPPGVALPPGPRPGGVLGQAPGMSQGGPGSMPPAAPSHIPPPMQPMAPGVPPMGVRMPPGPPPGVPPQTRPLMPKPLGVLSAKPQLNKAEIKTDSVIESKPVMRNLKSDVTRFVPTHLKVKRPDGRPGIGPGLPGSKPGKKGGEEEKKMSMFTQPKAPVKEPKTKDDAYNEFMKEMKDFM